MKDISGKDLSVGQIIAMTVSGYEELQIGTVIGFTPKKVKIQNSGGGDGSRFPNQVAIIGHVKD